MSQTNNQSLSTTELLERAIRAHKTWNSEYLKTMYPEGVPEIFCQPALPCAGGLPDEPPVI